MFIQANLQLLELKKEQISMSPAVNYPPCVPQESIVYFSIHVFSESLELNSAQI
jgi:hypothetical protein